MVKQESRKHHYVPEFLLRACRGTLNGYWWDARRGALACRRLGPKAFCRDLDLLLLERHPEGRDTLENKFFGGVDTRGARARERVLEAGPQALSEEERCDLMRLLFSLEVRAPHTIESIRAAVTGLIESLDGDRELLDAMERDGESDAPSAGYAEHLDHTMGDRFLVNAIQHLVDNAKAAAKAHTTRCSVAKETPRIQYRALGLRSSQSWPSRPARSDEEGATRESVIHPYPASTYTQRAEPGASGVAQKPNRGLQGLAG